MTTDRDDTITIRMDATTLSMMDAARSYLNLDKGKFIRQSVREKAAAVIADHERTRFSAEDWAAFFALLDAPPEPTARMKRGARKLGEIAG
ncbi:DUF1778 domain-containing protein [Xanthobacteraceae bacterium A53D]